ncbi:unnamed protein product [Sphagnum balticum]
MTILSEQDSIQVVNNQQFVQTTMTVTLGRDDENIPQIITISDPVTGNVYKVTINHTPPSYVYSHILQGWIPVMSQCINGQVLLMDSPPVNSSAIVNPSVVNSAAYEGPSYTQSFVKKVDQHRHRRINPYNHVVPAAFKSKDPKAAYTTRRTASYPAAPNSVSRLPTIVNAGLKGFGAYTAGGGFGFGVAIAFDIGCAAFGNLGSFTQTVCGSGGSDLVDALNNVENQVLNLTGHVTEIDNQILAMQAWQDNEKSTTNALQQEVNVVNNRLGYLENDVINLQYQINTISQATEKITQTYSAAFAKFATGLQEIEAQEQTLYNYTNQLATVTSQQIAAISTTLNTLDVKLTRLTMIVAAIYKKLAPRRALVYGLWNNTVNLNLSLPSCVFTQCIGLPPLPLTGRLLYTKTKLTVRRSRRLVWTRLVLCLALTISSDKRCLCQPHRLKSSH